MNLLPPKKVMCIIETSSRRTTAGRSTQRASTMVHYVAFLFCDAGCHTESDFVPAPTVKKEDKGAITKHLQQNAKGTRPGSSVLHIYAEALTLTHSTGVDYVVLFLDCDKEGENVSIFPAVRGSGRNTEYRTRYT